MHRYKSSWGLGSARTDWNAAAERLGNGVLNFCPRWLIFVQGVGETPGAGADQDTAGGVYWGENIYGARAHPVELSDPTKLVCARAARAAPLDHTTLDPCLVVTA